MCQLSESEMIKFSWQKAPDWANWISLNEDGVWYWSKYEPYPTEDGYWIIIGQKEIAFCETKDYGYELIKFCRSSKELV